MNNERLEKIEFDVVTHIKNPFYRKRKFCEDGYAKILLQRVEDCVASALFIDDFAKCTHDFITYISDEYGVTITKFNINTDGEYYLTFNSDGILPTKDLRNRIHECQLDFEQCYDDAKSHQLGKIEEEIANSIEDEEQRRKFIFDIEAKTLYNLISMYRCKGYNKERINEAVDHYAAFIRDTYGIQVNIDRRMLKPLKIKRIDDHIDHIARTDLPVHSEPYHYNISSNAQLNEIFDWTAQQVQNETNREAQQAYSRVLDAIAVIVISDEDRSNRLSIDEKIAVMHFLEDNES